MAKARYARKDREEAPTAIQEKKLKLIDMLTLTFD